jgi:hypothetical protein
MALGERGGHLVSTHLWTISLETPALGLDASRDRHYTPAPLMATVAPAR